MKKTSCSKERKTRREIKIEHIDSCKAILEPLIKPLSESLFLITNDLKSCHALNRNNLSINENNQEHQNNNFPNDTSQMSNYQLNNDVQCNNLDFNYSNIDDSLIYSQDHKDGLDINTFIQLPPQRQRDNNEEDSLMEMYQNPNDPQTNLCITDEIENSLNLFKDKLDWLSTTMTLYHLRSDSLFHSQKTYSIYDQMFKDIFCSLANDYGVKKTASSLNLSEKSLKRWIKQGTKRKAGGGRKELDTKMETLVYKWYEEQRKLNCTPTTRMIKKKAKELCDYSSFQASKGWFNKFKKKFHIDSFRKKAKPIV